MFSRQVPETTASRARPCSFRISSSDSRIESGRILEHLHREHLLAANPFVDLVRGDPALGEELGQEFAVVDLRRPGRHLVGDLPSHDGKRPLPGGDVMVVGVRDHAVEIEKNGFRRHELW